MMDRHTRRIHNAKDTPCRSPNRPNLALYVAGFLILAMAAYGPIHSSTAITHLPTSALCLVSRTWAMCCRIWLPAGCRVWRMAHARRFRSGPGGVFGTLALTAAEDRPGITWRRTIRAWCGTAAHRAGLRRAAGRDAAEVRLALPVLVAFGALGVWWWSATGDLRPYLLIQLAPLVLIPLIQWQTAAPVAQRKAFGLAIVLYVLAKFCEIGDRPCSRH